MVWFSHSGYVKMVWFSYSGDVIQCMETVMAPYPLDTVGHCVGQSAPMDIVWSIG